MNKTILSCILLFGITVAANAQSKNTWVSSVNVEGAGKYSPSIGIDYFFGKHELVLPDSINPNSKADIALQVGVGVRSYLFTENYLGHSPVYYSGKIRGVASNLAKGIGMHFFMEYRRGTYWLYKDVTATAATPIKDTRLMGAAGLNYTYHKVLLMLSYYPKEYNPKKYVVSKLSPFANQSLGVSVNFNF